MRVLIDFILNNPALFELWLKLWSNLKKRAILKEIKVRENERILDIACGIGNMASIFPSSAYVGVDARQCYIDFAQKKYRDRTFEVMDAYDLKFNENFFDYILVVGFFHHLDDEDILKVLKGCNTILKRNSKILILEAVCPNSNLSLTKKLLCNLDRGRYIRKMDEYQRLFVSHYKIEKSYLIPTKFLELPHPDHCIFILRKDENRD